MRYCLQTLTWQTNPSSVGNMIHNHKKRNGKGLNGKNNQPRLIGEIVRDLLQSNEPLAVAFRKYLAEKTGGCEAQEGPDGEPRLDLYPHTELCVDLKLDMRTPGKPQIGELMAGILVRDAYDHYSFMENATAKSKTVKRKSHLFRGAYFNLLTDGKSFTISVNHVQKQTLAGLAEICGRAADELYMLKGLIERKDGLGNR